MAIKIIRALAGTVAISAFMGLGTEASVARPGTAATRNRRRNPARRSRLMDQAVHYAWARLLEFAITLAPRSSPSTANHLHIRPIIASPPGTEFLWLETDSHFWPGDLSFPNVWPAPDLQVDFCELVSNQSAVMYPAPEHSLWP